MLHDYKTVAAPDLPKTGRLRWFAVGLGTPLIGLLLILTLTSAKGTNSSVADGEPLPADPLQDTPLLLETLKPIEISVARRVPLPAPAPTYDTVEFEVRAGDTLDRLFRKHGLHLGSLAAIVALPDAKNHLRLLRPGDRLRIEHDRGTPVSLRRDLGLTGTLLITRNDEGGYTAEIVERPVQTKKRLSYGRIESSLFGSAAAAGMPDKLIMNLASIFAWDIDFVLDIRKGDDYYLLYEEIYQDGKFVTTGEIIAAEFNNNGRTFQAVRYVNADGRTDYFTPEGRSVRKAFIRAPVDFTRISSSFNPNRRHPILNTIRAHRGVDYAAPGGTPIKAAGDGKVIFRGRKGGYGNAVIIQHGGNITTLYAHMSKFAPSAPLNGRVRQGDVIGYVGATGLATAPHLHYEYQLNGVHRNPRTVPLPQADPIGEEYKADFLTASEQILNELQQFKRTQVALASD